MPELGLPGSATPAQPFWLQGPGLEPQTLVHSRPAQEPAWQIPPAVLPGALLSPWQPFWLHAEGVLHAELMLDLKMAL